MKRETIEDTKAWLAQPLPLFSAITVVESGTGIIHDGCTSVSLQAVLRGALKLEALNWAP